MKRLLPLLLAALAWAAEPKPARMPVSTWVREDLFAGYMTGDMARFESGMNKVDEILAASPQSPDALAWRGSGQTFLAVRAHEVGDAKAFEKLYADARASLAAGRAAGAKSPALVAVMAIEAGTDAVFSDRLPEAHRRAAWLRLRENLTAVRAAQMPAFEKFPVHLRGEVLSGLAQAAQRLGDAEEANAKIAELIAAFPDSPYAARARRWQEKPELAGRTSLVCQSCHEGGRLEAVQKRMAAAAAKN